MAVTPQIHTVGLNPLLRDLRKMSLESVREVRRVVKGALEPMRRTAVAQAPGTGRTIGSQWRAQMRGASAALTNSHPGVRPHEFGGVIRPKGAPITIAESNMIYGPGGAIDESKDDTERDLLQAFGRLARANGW